MTDQLCEALRCAMMVDAQHHRADAKFNAACEVYDEESETAHKKRVQWQRAFEARPERRRRRAELQRRRRRDIAAEKVR